MAPLSSADNTGTVTPKSAEMPIPGLTRRDLKWRTGVRCQVSHQNSAVDLGRFDQHVDVTFPTLPESEVVRKTFLGGSDGHSECGWRRYRSCNTGSALNAHSVAAGIDRNCGFAIRIGRGLVAYWSAEVHSGRSRWHPAIGCAQPANVVDVWPAERTRGFQRDRRH